MDGEERFNRRVAAILFADVSGYSTLVGQDDERTAHAIEALLGLVRQVVESVGGRAEQHAGDALIAVFDSVKAAVDAALTAQGRLASRELAGVQISVRMGVHIGDVLLREGASVGTAVGDAVNIAARLQAIAPPGTVCISDAVYRQLRARLSEQVIDLGRRRLKNIPGFVHAFVIVPEGVTVTARRVSGGALWFRAAALALILAVVLAGAFYFTGRFRERPLTESSQGRVAIRAPTPTAPGGEAREAQVTLGVMAFRGRGTDAPDDWRCEALRDGLNTQLSQLSRIKVYSKEFIDFLVKRRGLTEIEVANELGITKMLTGSFTVAAGTLHIETHVVDVGTGVLEASHSTTGSQDRFAELQSDMVSGVVAKLNLPVTPEERAALAARDTAEDALRLLLEAEGGAGARPSGQPSPTEPGRPLSFLELFVQAAYAAEPAGDDAAIRAVLEQYRAALQSGDPQAVGVLYAAFSDEQRSAQSRYFENVRDLEVDITNVDVAIVGDEAVVSYTRADRFVDRRTGRPMNVTIRLTKTLKRDAGDWRFLAQ